ncbi:MAG: integrase, partial [Novosphingobium sp.]
MLKGIRNTYGVKSQQKAPAEVDVLTAMLATIEGMGLRAVRDRAILAIGFASALRRSELVAVQYEQLSFVSSG